MSEQEKPQLPPIEELVANAKTPQEMFNAFGVALTIVRETFNFLKEENFDESASAILAAIRGDMTIIPDENPNLPCALDVIGPQMSDAINRIIRESTAAINQEGAEDADESEDCSED